MRFVIQRVSSAQVSVDEQVVGKIGYGFVVLIGISEEDITVPQVSVCDAFANEKKEALPEMGLGEGSRKIADKMVKKLLGMRIFPDENGKTNLSLAEVGGQLLLISQFTLYADCKKGNRPSFTKAGNPVMAEALYEYIIARCEEETGKVEKGIFGAEMKVSLVNEGPFTIILDSDGL